MNDLKAVFFVMTDLSNPIWSQRNETPAPRPRCEVWESYTFKENDKIKIGINLSFSQTGNLAQFTHKLLCIKKHQTLIRYKHSVFLFGPCLNF